MTVGAPGWSGGLACRSVEPGAGSRPARGKDRMTDGEIYPRDMIGYGRTPPFADWPNKARIAVQFVINYEEGGENNILHGDAASEAFLSEIVGAAPWPGMRHMNMESIYEYGSRAGFWRLHRLFNDRSVPVTVYAVATAMARNREAVAAMNEAGWEIATHGLKWIDYRDTPPEIEALHIAEAVRMHTEIAGARPLGFYQGRSSINTIRLGMQEGGFVYCADTYADDLPYWLAGPRGPQLMTPYTLDANDMRFATPQGFNSGDQFHAYLKDSFDTLYAEGDVAPKMLSVGLHCRLVGRPGRALALARFVDYALGHDRVWIPTRLDIARHWIAKHPPPGGWKPSRLARTLFIERFGGVYEHSPWVAAAAHDAGLGSGADTADGLAKALAAAATKGTTEQKRALIEAHPDLAGRLALAKTLTADSTNEQASAGLDRLTPEEMRQFAELNDAYRAKFGFPFIMAVKGKSKADILATFRSRLDHDAGAETATALAEIDRIAALRLKDILP
jgi:OHCU decarboxylase